MDGWMHWLGRWLEGRRRGNVNAGYLFRSELVQENTAIM